MCEQKMHLKNTTTSLLCNLKLDMYNICQRVSWNQGKNVWRVDTQLKSHQGLKCTSTMMKVRGTASKVDSISSILFLSLFLTCCFVQQTSSNCYDNHNGFHPNVMPSEIENVTDTSTISPTMPTKDDSTWKCCCWEETINSVSGNVSIKFQLSNNNL